MDEVIQMIGNHLFHKSLMLIQNPSRGFVSHNQHPVDQSYPFLFLMMVMRLTVIEL